TDTHNIFVYLSKSDASEGFNQIIDFLNGNSLKYALTVNPNIYVSCIKQFWTTIAVKQRVWIVCPTRKSAELARMGYEKPSTKLTFYKAFFSSQWKFLIHTILQCMNAKRTSWNDFVHQWRLLSYVYSHVENSIFLSIFLTACISYTTYSTTTTTSRYPFNIPGRTNTTTITAGRMIAKMDQDDVVVLKDDKEEDKEVADAEEAMVDKKVVTATSEIVIAASEIITTAEAQVSAATTATLTVSLVRVTAAPSRRRKGVVIRDPEEELTTSTIIHAETKSKDKCKGILVEEPKPLKKK
nr:hypothetical protein [Tanacetum cinerariifolium]